MTPERTTKEMLAGLLPVKICNWLPDGEVLIASPHTRQAVLLTETRGCWIWKDGKVSALHDALRKHQ